MTIKKNRKTYTAEFKAQALKLAERVGVAEAARQLKIYETQIYNWRSAAEKKYKTSLREAELAALQCLVHGVSSTGAASCSVNQSSKRAPS